MNLKAFKYGTVVHKSRISIQPKNDELEIAVLQYKNKYFFYFGIIKNSTNYFGLFDMKKVKSLEVGENMYNELKNEYEKRLI